MIKLLLTLFLVSVCQFSRAAHDHIEVREVPGNPSKLGIIVTTTNLNPVATYFPLGEAPSFDLYAFPGGAYATELTFSAFNSTSTTQDEAYVRVDILAVSGATGGTISFWEDGASSPTHTRPVGWSSGGADNPSFIVSEDNTGYGHRHGRAFTASKAGVYHVTFRMVDTLGNCTSSDPFVVHFTVIDPPQLAISKIGSDIKLTFTGRDGLSYDVQSSTTLQHDAWTTIGDPLDGNGGPLEFFDPIVGRPRVFYRLVEY